MMKSLKYLLLLLAATLMGLAAATAQNAVTPYSMYGYGILNDFATSTQRQMGGIGVAMNNGRQINVMNPASYASIDSLTFLWDMGADVSMLWSKEGSAKEHAVGGGLDYITMQFPFSRHWGGSAGLLPYSSVGYSFGNPIEHGTRSNTGSGGINMAYIGVGGNYAGFGFGANISYTFGTITNSVYATPEGSNNTLFEQVMRIRDWNLNLGLQYTARFSKTERATVGFTYSPKKSFHGKMWATFQYITETEQVMPDTVGYSRINGNAYQPHCFGVGLNYTRQRTSRFMAEADFNYQLWKDTPYPELLDSEGKVVFNGMDFSNRWKVAAGVEYTPKVRGGNYLQRMTYRFGGYYTHDYLIVRGNNVHEYGVSCGFGLPTPEGKTVINLGLEWKRRAASPQQLIGENYFNITLGVNFNEVWFWQRKLR